MGAESFSVFKPTSRIDGNDKSAPLSWSPLRLVEFDTQHATRHFPPRNEQKCLDSSRFLMLLQ